MQAAKTGQSKLDIYWNKDELLLQFTGEKVQHKEINDVPKIYSNQ